MRKRSNPKNSVMRLASVLAISPLLISAALSQDIVERGKYLVTAGSCVTCHSKPGGEAFAGGLPLATPFGTIVTPNITPDKETGIGNYTDDQFYEALHNGVNSRGQYMYPAFPFTSYTNIKRDDVLAIKAYLFSLKPVNSPNQGNNFVFPTNIRASLAVWRQLYFRPGEFQPDPAKSDQINRGAYLVKGLEHCGECHTRRNPLGAMESSKGLQGASIQGWYAPNITSDWKTGLGSWSEDELFNYLKTGASPKGGVAVGPMSEVVHASLADLKDEDVRAIAIYLKSTPPESDLKDAPSAKAASTDEGAAVYVNHCASCHGVDGKGIQGAIPGLRENGSVTAATGDNVIKVVLGGLRSNSNYGPMPSFVDSLSDEEIAQVTNYIRTNWGNEAKPNATLEQVASARKSTAVMLALGEGDTTCPEELSDAEKDVRGKAETADVSAILKGASMDNLSSTVRDVVSKVKEAAPSASASDLTNGITAAYCKYLDKDTRVAAQRKRPLLTKFSQLTYTLASSGKLYGPGNAPVTTVK